MEVEGRPTFWYDASDSSAWLSALDTEGFCVLKGVANSEEVAKANSLLWDWLEACSKESRPISRAEPSTWTEKNGWPGGQRGFLSLSKGGGHCEASWYVRGLPAVKSAFAKIWSTDSLLVSFDTFISWRPWGNPAALPTWTPRVEGYHIDQNPFHKPGKQCVQGMMPLRPVTPEVGGLAVVPRSHADSVQVGLKARHSQWAKIAEDWCVLNPGDDIVSGAVLIVSEPGDLILWDSRLVHGGLIGPGGDAARGDDLPRLAITLCMTPKSFATPEVLEGRRAAFENGATLTHWPHFLAPHTTCCNNQMRRPAGYTPPALTPEQEALID